MIRESPSIFFTVVVPTFNRLQSLKRSLDSVFSQSFPFFEIIVIDDGSTDNTQAYLHSISDDRLTILYNKNSGGPAYPRNRGIIHSRGDWIAFLDSGDIWDPHKLKVIHSEISLSDSDIYCHNEVMCDAEGKHVKYLIHGPSSASLYKSMLLYGNRLSTSCVVARKSFLRKNSLLFDDSQYLQIVEDYDFWLRAAYLGASFRFIPASLGCYIVESFSISNRSFQLSINRRCLIYKHVFTIQDFCQDRMSLWNQLRHRFDYPSFTKLLRNNSYGQVFMFLLARIFKSPRFMASSIIVSVFIRLRRLVIIRQQESTFETCASLVDLT